jgi:hypothetical protein
MGLAMVLAFFPGWLEVTLHQDPIGTVAVTVLPFALWVAGSSRQKEHPTIARGIATVSMGFGFVFLLLTGGYVGAVVAIGVSYLAGVGLTQLWLLGSRSDYRRPG